MNTEIRADGQISVALPHFFLRNALKNPFDTLETPLIQKPSCVSQELLKISQQYKKYLKFLKNPIVSPKHV